MSTTATAGAYLGLLGRVTKRMRWRCLSYCLMGIHMHLLIEHARAEPRRRDAPTPRLVTRSTFNRRYDHSGHLFKDRYDAVSDPERPAELWLTAAYIARNPVKAGLCGTAGDWRWGSHAAIEHHSAPEWLDLARLYAYFGAARRRRPQELRSTLVDALAHKR